MGVLGNRDQYVCNQIRAIRANLSNVSGTTFQTTLVSKTSNVFWINSRSGSKDGLKRRRTHDPATSEGDGQGVEDIHTRQVFANVSGGGGDHNLGGGSFPVESKRRRAKEYTVPHNSRPGQRCASAKAELGDDLLTVVAVIPTRPFDFETREYLREFLSVPARKLRSRQYYRKIKTSDKPKRREVFDLYVQHEAKLKREFRGVQNTRYSSYKWGWNLKIFDDPSPDPRAVCIDVMFMVGDQRRLHSQHPRVPCCVGKRIQN